MKTNNLQQCLSGFSTVAIIGGPLIVRVHKALDSIYADSSKHGFFISVDFKFRKTDALYIGTPGYDGFSKTEATREANSLSAKITSYYSTMMAAHELALKWDTSTNRYTVKIQTDRFNALVEKYNAEFV
jgi:hypothetical protein